MVVVLTTTRLESAFPPTVTVLATVKFVPVIVTDVVPVFGPELGAMPEIVAGIAELLLQPC